MVELRRSTRKRPALDVQLVVEKPLTKWMKKATEASQKGTAKANKSEGLLGLPPELFLEILSYLKPQHFVHLMYLCRSFYEVLSDDSEYTSKLWRDARSRVVVPIPDPPADMREYQWATFIYATHCQECGKQVQGPKSREFILFTLRRRVCRSCMSKNIIRGGYGTLPSIPKMPYIHVATLEILMPSDKNLTGSYLFNKYVWNMEKYYWKPDISRITRYIAAEFPQVFFSEIEPRKSKAFMVWTKEKLRQRQETMSHAAKCAEWETKMQQKYGKGDPFKGHY